MKLKLFLCVLCLCGITSFKPANVLSETTLSPDASLTVNNISLVENGEITGNTVTGAVYNLSANTLTLNGYNGGAIKANEMDLNIVISGNNTVTASSGMSVIETDPFGSFFEDRLDNSISISGNGILNVSHTGTTGTTYGIFSGKVLDIRSGTINVTAAASSWTYGIGAETVNINVSNGAKVTSSVAGGTNANYAFAAGTYNIIGKASLKEGDTAASAKTVASLTLSTADVGKATKKYVSVTPYSASAPGQPPKGNTKASNNNITKIDTPLKTISIQSGKSLTIPYVIYSGNKEVKAKLAWKSSNAKIAKVSQSGKITIPKKTKKGKASVTAAAQNGKKLKVTIKVSAKAVKLKKAAVNAPKSLRINQLKRLTVKLTPAKATGQKITFKSSNANSLYVDKAGLMTAKKKGTYTVTVRIGKITVKKKIKIK